MATNLGLPPGVHSLKAVSKTTRTQVQTSKYPAKPSHLRTLTLSLEMFVRLMRAMDRTHAYNRQLLMFWFALCDSPNTECKLYREALQLYPTKHYLHGRMLECLGTAIIARHNREGDFEMMADVNEAISVLRRLIPIYSPNRPNLYSTIRTLAKVLRARFIRLRDSNDLEDSIKHFHLALQRISPSHLDDDERGVVTLELALTLLVQFSYSDDIAPLNRALDYFRQCEQLLPSGHYDSMRCSVHLLRSLIRRYKKSHCSADIEEATRHLVDVVTGYQGPDRISILLECANSLIYWERVSITSHLDLTINCLEEAVHNLPPEENHRRPMLLIELANAYKSRFEGFNRTADLNHYVSYTKDAMDLCPPSHADYPRYMLMMSGAYARRYGHSELPQDLQKAISYGRSGLNLLPSQHFESGPFINMSGLLLFQFDRTQDISILNEAIDFARRAVELTRLAEPLTRSLSSHQLADGLKKRFEGFGAIADLDEAIQRFREAVVALPFGYMGRSATLGELADCLRLRYLTLWHDDDILEAMKCFIQAESDLRPNDKDEGNGVHRLALICEAVLSVLPNPPKSMLDTAVHLSQQALGSSNKQNRSTALNNLAVTLQHRALHLRNKEDLNQTIALYRESTTLNESINSDNDFSQAQLGNLAEALRIRFELQGKISDLEEAISTFLLAISRLPDNHPDQVKLTRRLALAYASRSRILQLPLDFDRAAVFFEKSTKSVQSVTICHLQAADLWANTARDLLHNSTLQAYTSALLLLDRYVMMSQTIEDRYKRLSTLRHSIPQNAASWAIAQGQPEIAVELLEQGRTMLWSQAGRYRTPLDRLNDINPSLAEEFQRLSILLERNMVSPSAQFDNYDPSIYRSQSQQWEDVVEKIRAEEGFSYFLKQTSFATLQKATVNGPVVVINIDIYRSDAVIVQNAHPPIIVPVPQATPNAISSLATDLSAALCLNEDEFKMKGAKITEILRCLWDVLVCPIVEALSKCGISQGSRVWWCPIAELWSLPIHAAGPYKPGKRNLPDIFVSSYTPTLSALLQSIKTQGNVADRTSPNMLVIGQAQTPGQTPLPSVLEEIRQVRESCPSVSLLNGADATRHTVVCGLQQCSWVHFACHGNQDLKRPFNSHFVLHNDTLSLLDIAQTGMPNADFAFLSACHSAAGNRQTPNEAIHLASGLQYSGFKSVVGTMWAMADIDGPVVAKEFYQYMFRNPEGVDHQDAAVALNLAIKVLRRKKVPLERWINLVHIGA